MEHGDALAFDPWGASVEDHESNPVEPHEAAEGRQPEIAVARLQDVVDRVLRESVLGGPGLEPGVGVDGWRKRGQQRQTDDERRDESHARHAREGTRWPGAAPRRMGLAQENGVRKIIGPAGRVPYTATAF